MVIMLTASNVGDASSESLSSVIINDACSKNSGNVSYFAITFVISSRMLSNLSGASTSLDSCHIFMYPDAFNNFWAVSAGDIDIQSKSNADKNSSAMARCFPVSWAVRSPSIKDPPIARNFAIADGPKPRRGLPITRINDISSNGDVNRRKYAIASRISARS